MSNTDNGPVPHAQDELPANVSDISVSRNAANGNAAASADWSLYQFKGGITVGGFGVDEYQNSRNLAGINLALYLSKSRETKKEGVDYATQGSVSNETVASNPSFEISVAELLDLVKVTYRNAFGEYDRNAVRRRSCSTRIH